MWSRLTQRKQKSRIHRYLTTLAYIFQIIQLPLTAISTIILSITFTNAINKLLLVTGVITFFSEAKVYFNEMFFFLHKNHLMDYNIWQLNNYPVYFEMTNPRCFFQLQIYFLKSSLTQQDKSGNM
jgi:hypothetical protein